MSRQLARRHGLAAFAAGSEAMPLFYFHVRSNGRLEEDRRGRHYDDQQEACVGAIKSMPQLLAKALKSAPQMRTKPLQHGNVYVTVNVVDEQRRAWVVKGTVIVSKASVGLKPQEGFIAKITSGRRPLKAASTRRAAITAMRKH
jgi:hypothetical protein